MALTLPRVENKTAFPSITGNPAREPIFPSPKIAEPSVTIPTGLTCSSFVISISITPPAIFLKSSDCSFIVPVNFDVSYIKRVFDTHIKNSFKSGTISFKTGIATSNLISLTKSEIMLKSIAQNVGSRFWITNLSFSLLTSLISSGYASIPRVLFKNIARFSEAAYEKEITPTEFSLLV